jgi:hypothetical protein
MKHADHDTVTAFTLAELEGRTELVFGSKSGNIRIWHLERREAFGYGLTNTGSAATAISVTQLNERTAIVYTSEEKTGDDAARLRPVLRMASLQAEA